MRAIVEKIRETIVETAIRWVETPTISAGQDAEDYGPIALTNRGNAHVFSSYEEAGKWVDANSQHGDFVIHGVKT